MEPCKAYAGLLDAFADGECTPEEAHEIQQHLEHCPECTAYLAELRALQRGFPDLDSVTVPEGFSDGVMANIRAETSRRRSAALRWKKAALPIAACLAIFVTANTLLPQLLRESSSNMTGSGNSTSSAAAAETSAGAAAGEAAETGEAGNAALDTHDAAAEAPETTAPAETSVPSPERSKSGTSSAKDSVSSHSAAVPSSEAPEPDSTPETDETDNDDSGGYAQVTVGPAGIALEVSLPDGETYAQKEAWLEAQLAAPGTSGLLQYTGNGECLAWSQEQLDDPSQPRYSLFLRFADGSCAALPLPADVPPTGMVFSDGSFSYDCPAEDETGGYHCTVSLSRRTVVTHS